MGRIVKKLSDDTSKYYWYPGEKVEWIRAVVALAVGGGIATLLIFLITQKKHWPTPMLRTLNDSMQYGRPWQYLQVDWQVARMRAIWPWP